MTGPNPYENEVLKDRFVVRVAQFEAPNAEILREIQNTDEQF